MLFRNIVLLVHIALQRCEYVALVKQILPTTPFQLQQALVGNPVRVCGSAAVFRRDGEILKLFTENNDGLFRKKWVLSWSEFRRRCVLDIWLLCGKETRGSLCTVERV